MDRDVLSEVVETQRLTLRPFALGDVEDVLVMDRVQEPSWAIVLEGRVIGGVVLLLDFSNRSAETGYSAGRRHWSQGFGTEAVR